MGAHPYPMLASASQRSRTFPSARLAGAGIQSKDCFGATSKPARAWHDLMTWVTVQSHDIGDTFPGIYALEKVFGVGRASAICFCRQEQERVVRVAVWSV